MKFLADENISPKVVNRLKEAGVNIVSIKEYSAGLSDEEILVKANQQNMVLITFDNDFAELIYRYKRKAIGIIFLKFVPNSLQQISEVILNVLSAKTKIEGNFVTVTEKRIRVIRIK